jgi:Asp-tRNA(Asn)/Glu-tRNA(Gln) amidotransferase A subunit family amidase
LTELWRLSGLELRRMIAAKEVKPSEIMAVILARIEKLNPKRCKPIKKFSRRRVKGYSLAFPYLLKI